MTKTPKAIRFTDGETLQYGPLWDDAIAKGHAVPLYGKEGETALKEYRRAELLKLIKPGDTLTAVCTHRNRTGSAARFKVFIPAVSPEGRTYIRDITRMVAMFAGFKLTLDDEISMGGYGFSKSFQIGYSLGCSLWPNGTPEPHGRRNGEPDRDGGYAINVTAA